jgi:PAS domain S-box-containing protein
MKIEDALPVESQSEAVEVRKWLLDYLSKTAPGFASDVSGIAEQYVRQATLLSAAVNNAPVAMFVLDKTGDILYANDSFAKLVERPRSKLVGTRYEFSKESEAYHNFMVDFEGGHVLEETIYTDRFGSSPKWIEVNATSFKLNDETVVAIVCFRDVTKRKSLEDRLKDLVEKL